MNEACPVTLRCTHPSVQAQSSKSPLGPARKSHHLREHAGEAVFNKATCICRKRRTSVLPSPKVVKESRGGRVPSLTDSRPQQRRWQSNGCFCCFPSLRPRGGSHQVSHEGNGYGENLGTTKPSMAPVAAAVNRIACRAGTDANTDNQPRISVTLNPIRTKTQTSPVTSKTQPVVGSPSVRRKASTITIIKPAPPPQPRASKASMAKTSPTPSLSKPHLGLPMIMKASSKSAYSPPMNISKPQPAEDFIFLTRKTSPMNLNPPSPEKKVAMVGQNNMRTVCTNRGMKPVVRCRGQLPQTQKEPCRTTLDEEPLQVEKPRVVWREGLLQRLGRMHGLGSCKLSLEELIELDDNSFLHDVELHGLPQGVPLPPTVPAPSRASMASTWKMEFEGGRPILPLKREDVKPKLVSSVWPPFSHTNSLFEASRRHYGNYNYEEWR